MEKDICDGCELFCDKNDYCQIREFGQQNRCPCSSCLVKMRCRETCDEWEQLRDILWRHTETHHATILQFSNS